mgnify:CR=1 FL=1
MIYLFVDIIIFAAIAVYIFFRLNKQLGKIDEEEKRDIAAKIININSAKKRTNKYSDLKEKVIGSKVTQGNTDIIVKESDIKNLDDINKKSLIKILKKLNFSSRFFIEGSKSAFQSILKAFAEDQLESVKFLISDKIYQGFSKANEKRKVQGKTLITNIISFDNTKIVGANISGNNASITIEFNSQQINCVCDKEGNLIAGSKDEISQVNDIWTFKKDINSTNPNWIVSATSHN